VVAIAALILVWLVIGIVLVSIASRRSLARTVFSPDDEDEGAVAATTPADVGDTNWVTLTRGWVSQGTGRVALVDGRLHIFGAPALVDAAIGRAAARRGLPVSSIRTLERCGTWQQLGLRIETIDGGLIELWGPCCPELGERLAAAVDGLQLDVSPHEFSWHRRRVPGAGSSG
jgi:hypothetical protein